LNYYRFFTANWKILLYAILLALFSGFGQTFLLSLYIPSILSDLKFSHTFYSTLYASATLLSGVSIIFVGKLIDRVPLKAFTFAVILGIIAANIAASFAFNAISLFVAIFMLRFFGQGLLSHTAMTAMGRYFSKARGKALSVAYLGFPIAEGLFPIIIVLSISMLGWRHSFQASALSILVLLLPITFLLLRNFKKENIKEDFDSKVQLVKSVDNEKIWTQKEIIKDKRLYILAPTAFLVGFILTALFFFQTFIAEYKGWSIEWMAGNITAYAIASFMFSIIAGPIIDKFSAKKVFPFILIPMIIGLTFLILFKSPFATTLFWFFVGISAGLNPTVSNAIYAEEFGTLSLGTVRSLFTFVMIASTALGPITYSLLLSASLSFNTIHLMLITFIFINVITLYFSLIKKRRS
jgi:MFS family permease